MSGLTLEGESWLAYMGVPYAYPDYMPLAIEVTDAMWDAASEVLREHMAEDPVLRALSDDRYGLWEPVDVPVGSLPPGIEITYRADHRIVNGVIARPRESLHPKIYAEVTWEGDQWTWQPTLGLDAVVQAWLPVPLDVSALIAVVAAEGDQAVPRPRRQRRARPDVDWNTYGACTRRGCWAAEGSACIDVRTTWSTRRPGARPHPGRTRRDLIGADHG